MEGGGGGEGYDMVCVLNCQSERLTVGWPTFLMLANFRSYHLSSVCGKDQKVLKKFGVKSA